MVRIEWDANSGIVVLLDDLQDAGVRIDQELRTKADLTANSNNDNDLYELARRGDLMALVRVLRVRDKTLALSQARDQAKAMIDRPEPVKQQ